MMVKPLMLLIRESSSSSLAELFVSSLVLALTSPLDNNWDLLIVSFFGHITTWPFKNKKSLIRSRVPARDWLVCEQRPSYLRWISSFARSCFRMYCSLNTWVALLMSWRHSSGGGAISFSDDFKNAGFATLRCKMLLICFSKESGVSARIRRGDSATSTSSRVQSRGGDAGWTVLSKGLMRHS